MEARDILLKYYSRVYREKTFCNFADYWISKDKEHVRQNKEFT